MARMALHQLIARLLLLIAEGRGITTAATFDDRLLKRHALSHARLRVTRAIYVHLLVVWDWRRRSVLPSNWDNVIDDDPRMISTGKDSVDILSAYVCDMVE